MKNTCQHTDLKLNTLMASSKCTKKACHSLEILLTDLLTRTNLNKLLCSKTTLTSTTLMWSVLGKAHLLLLGTIMIESNSPKDPNQKMFLTIRGENDST